VIFCCFLGRDRKLQEVFSAYHMQRDKVININLSEFTAEAVLLSALTYCFKQCVSTVV